MRRVRRHLLRVPARAGAESLAARGEERAPSGRRSRAPQRELRSTRVPAETDSAGRRAPGRADSPGRGAPGQADGPRDAPSRCVARLRRRADGGAAARRAAPPRSSRIRRAERAGGRRRERRRRGAGAGREHAARHGRGGRDGARQRRAGRAGRRARRAARGARRRDDAQAAARAHEAAPSAPSAPIAPNVDAAQADADAPPQARRERKAPRDRILSAAEWRALAVELDNARGPKPVRVIEQLFATHYTPLLGATLAGETDAAVRGVVDSWRTSFEHSYREAFSALRVTGKRPPMVFDAPDIAARIARLNGARGVKLLLVDAMRFDLGERVAAHLKEMMVDRAILVERSLLWAALPPTTTAQISLLARGPDGLRETMPPSESEPAIARGRAVATLRRERVGARELMKLDLVEARSARRGAAARRADRGHRGGGRRRGRAVHGEPAAADAAARVRRPRVPHDADGRRQRDRPGVAGRRLARRGARPGAGVARRRRALSGRELDPDGDRCPSRTARSSALPGSWTAPEPDPPSWSGAAVSRHRMEELHGKELLRPKGRR